LPFVTQEHIESPGERWKVLVTGATGRVGFPIARALAGQPEIIIADEPEIPTPAGASETDSTVMPQSGAKNRTSSARSGKPYRFAA